MSYKLCFSFQEETSETASHCSLMIPPPQVDNINSVKICKCSVNRKLSSDESENESHGIADLYKPGNQISEILIL